MDGDLGCFSVAASLEEEMSVETTAPSTVTRPTGEEYLESSRDRRKTRQDEGGEMETASTDTRRVQASPAGITLRARLRPWTSAIAGAVADSAHDDSLDRMLATASSDSFATLPRRRQSRLLDRGFRFPS